MKQVIILISLLFLGCNSPIKKTKKVEKLYTYNIEDKLKELGIELSEPKLPKGVNIKLSVQSNNLIFLSGNGPIFPNGDRITGKVGAELSIEQGYAAARQTAINQLSVLKAHIGDLNRVVKIVKVFGMVNADASFTEHPKVINGFSDLMIEVFEERGQHARSAVGVSSLPWNLAVEVEMIVQIKE